jgi:hypothetical protein
MAIGRISFPSALKFFPNDYILFPELSAWSELIKFYIYLDISWGISIFDYRAHLLEKKASRWAFYI